MQVNRWRKGDAREPERTEARARDVVSAAKKELKNMITAAQTEDLFPAILPVEEEIVNNILDALKKGRFYEDGTWKGLPQSKKGDKVKEDTLYGPFTNIANEIISIIEKKFPKKRNCIKGKWINCSSKIAKSQDCLAASIQPDVAYVSEQMQEDDLKACDERLRELDQVQTRSMTKSLVRCIIL